MQQGKIYYSEGPVFLCAEGVPVYISQVSFNSAYQQYGPGTIVVACKQVKHQEEEGLCVSAIQFAHAFPCFTKQS